MGSDMGDGPDSIEAIQDLWQNASPEDKFTYLFKAVSLSRQQLCRKADDLNKMVSEMKHMCECRLESCENKYMKKKTAKIFAFVVGFGVVCFMLGAGYLTWSEVAKLASHGALVIP